MTNKKSMMLRLDDDTAGELKNYCAFHGITINSFISMQLKKILFPDREYKSIYKDNNKIISDTQDRVAVNQ